VHLTVHAEFGGRLPGKGRYLPIPDLAGQPTLPGYGLVSAILLAGGQVIARVREGIALPFAEAPDRGWLPDGSRVSWLNAPSGRKEDRLPVRVTEHNAVMPGPDGTGQVSETCTIITTLLDHRAVPADAVRDAYLTRWSASETMFGEDKATIAGAGRRTSGPVLRSGCPRLVISEAWAWLTGTQLVRASSAAALRSGHAAARALRRRSRQAVTADEESFTAGRHHAIRSMTTTQVTATSSLQALAAAADAAARAVLHTLNLPGRQRHSERAQKARPKFPHATATKITVTGKPQVTVFAPGFY
jgi:Flp pilus assembly protein TadG